MISRRLVVCLGASQLVSWGVTYYLIAIFAGPIARETGWSLTIVNGGFSAGLLAMGVVSPWVGRAIDRRGGRPVMISGSILSGIGCLILASARDVSHYYAGWLVLGIAMRMTLYDAAFASLARVAGPAARGPISQITLLGGLASTTLWPIGQFLTDAFGWRIALVCYAGLAILTVPLHLTIPRGRYVSDPETHRSATRPLATTRSERILASSLFVASTTLASGLNSAMSAHMIAILAGLGLSASVAVWIATLRGVGQFSARFCEVAFGGRLDPLVLGLLASALLPIAFGFGMWSATSTGAAILFALLYGAGNGLLTITRGTQPLVLFDPASYGSIVGQLIAPGFFISALSPVAFAAVIERYGFEAALVAAIGISAIVVVSAMGLWIAFRCPADARRA